MVLYIEDNTSDVEFVQYQLTDYRDVQLMSSPRADKGKNLALQYQPDVIVVDQFLPDMDSDALISQLREHKTMQQVTIVGLISPGEDGSALQEAGTDFVLNKPLELANLLEALQVTARPRTKEPRTKEPRTKQPRTHCLVAPVAPYSHVLF